jgi:hypothetical protein
MLDLGDDAVAGVVPEHELRKPRQGDVPRRMEQG